MELRIMERRILARKKYSAHKDDAYLSIVLCRHRDREWVTWVATKEGNEEHMSHGRYFQRAEDALRDFLERGTFAMTYPTEGADFMRAERTQHES